MYHIEFTFIMINSFIQHSIIHTTTDTLCPFTTKQKHLRYYYNNASAKNNIYFLDGCTSCSLFKFFQADASLIRRFLLSELAFFPQRNCHFQKALNSALGSTLSFIFLDNFAHYTITIPVCPTKLLQHIF